MATIKTDAELNAQTDAVIKVNGNREITPGLDNALRKNVIASKQSITTKDVSGGYVGLTLMKINFKNVLATFTSFLTNSNTAARTYTFQDRNGIIADDTDIAALTDGTTPFSFIVLVDSAGHGWRMEVGTDGFLIQPGTDLGII